MSMQLTRNETMATAITSKEALKENIRRTGVYITNTGATAITIAKGVAAAVAGSGIVIQPNSTWFETDSEGYKCWKGAIQVIDTAVGSIGISETTEV